VHEERGEIIHAVSVLVRWLGLGWIGRHGYKYRLVPRGRIARMANSNWHGRYRS
jgi:hypothetical protein